MVWKRKRVVLLVHCCGPGMWSCLATWKGRIGDESPSQRRTALLMRVAVDGRTPLRLLKEKLEDPGGLRVERSGSARRLETNPDGSRASLLPWPAGLDSSFYASYYRGLEWLTALSVDSQLAWTIPGYLAIGQFFLLYLCLSKHHHGVQWQAEHGMPQLSAAAYQGAYSVRLPTLYQQSDIPQSAMKPGPTAGHVHGQIVHVRAIDIRLM